MVRIGAHLVSHDGLLYSREVFEGRQENMAPCRSADILDEASQLFA